MLRTEGGKCGLQVSVIQCLRQPPNKQLCVRLHHATRARSAAVRTTPSRRLGSAVVSGGCLSCPATAEAMCSECTEGRTGATGGAQRAAAAVCGGSIEVITHLKRELLRLQPFLGGLILGVFLRDRTQLGGRRLAGLLHELAEAARVWAVDVTVEVTDGDARHGGAAGGAPYAMHVLLDARVAPDGVHVPNPTHRQSRAERSHSEPHTLRPRAYSAH